MFFICAFKLCLALRYLHKEKRIVHRDLTPNNIMLGDKDKVTVSKYQNLKIFNLIITEYYSTESCSIEVSVLKGIFYICIVQYMAIGHLNCGLCD